MGVGFGAHELIRAHTGEGRERAKARGQSLGRPFKLTPHQRSAALRRRDRGETLTNIARSCNVHPSTDIKAYGVKEDAALPEDAGTVFVR